MKQSLSPRFFYLLSFMEGAAVMATELIGAKMLAPFFGSSLYVWASVLAITLGGLAMGYFTGGMLSSKKKNNTTLFYILLIAAALLMLMPFSATCVMDLLGHYTLLPAIVTCTLLFLFPPVFMMGMVSPLIVSSVTTDAADAGRAAGTVYAISTVGGIIATFLTGFYIIPNFGLKLPAIVIGSLLGSIPLVMLIKKNKITAILFIAVTAAFYYQAIYIKPAAGLIVRYRSEGLLGQVMVADWPVYNNKKEVIAYDRFLLVNRITQTRLQLGADSTNGFEYVSTIGNALSILPKQSRVLLMGLGGGSIANKLTQMGFTVDVCELDERIYQVALNPAVNYCIDDARHFIRTTANKYDALILDVFRGEENPAHCFTIEAFNDMKLILKKNGVLVINGNGFIKGVRGRGMRAVQKTLIAAGFFSNLVSTENKEEQSNLLFFASLDSNKQLGSLKGVSYLSLHKADLDNDVVMEDNRPMLDKLNLEAYRTWRTTSINYFNNAAKNGITAPYF
jgi:predicted membrane-bound spermidine synthase